MLQSIKDFFHEYIAEICAAIFVVIVFFPLMWGVFALFAIMREVLHGQAF